MGNKTCHDIKNSFIKNRNLLFNTLVRKSSFSVELGYGELDYIIIYILIVPSEIVLSLKSPIIMLTNGLQFAI